jgi:hypothetical protein
MLLKLRVAKCRLWGVFKTQAANFKTLFANSLNPMGEMRHGCPWTKKGLTKWVILRMSLTMTLSRGLLRHSSCISCADCMKDTYASGAVGIQAAQ